MSALQTLVEANANYTATATDTDFDPAARREAIAALNTEDQMTDGEILLRRFFFSPVGVQSLDHLLSCWRPGKGRGWTDNRVLMTLKKLQAAGLIKEVEGALETKYELTESAYRHYSKRGSAAIEALKETEQAQ